MPWGRDGVIPQDCRFVLGKERHRKFGKKKEEKPPTSYAGPARFDNELLEAEATSVETIPKTTTTLVRFSRIVNVY